MLTLRILENISFRTPDAIVTKTAGEVLSVNNIQFALSLVEAGKAEMEMDELMAELLRLDHNTDSDLYLDERIRSSAAVVAAYRTGNKQVFVEKALSLIKLYLKCQKEV